MMAVSLPSRVRAVTVYRKGAEVTRVAVIEAGSAGSRRRWSSPVSLSRSRTRRFARRSRRVRVRGFARRGSGSASDPPTEHLRPPGDAELEAARIAERLVAARLEQRRVELGRVSTLRHPTASGGCARRAAAAVARRSAPRAARIPVASRGIAPQGDRGARGEARGCGACAQGSRGAGAARDHREGAAARRAPEGRAHLARRRRGGLGSTCELVVRYRVPGARWAPAYSLELDPALRTGTLTIKAAVAQQTRRGLDGDVDLVVSTARPQDWHDLPELRSLRIGRRQAPAARPSPCAATRRRRAFSRTTIAQRARPASRRRRNRARSEDRRRSGTGGRGCRRSDSRRRRGRVAMPMSMPARSFAAQAIDRSSLRHAGAPEDVLDDALLDYASLRMAGPSERSAVDSNRSRRRSRSRISVGSSPKRWWICGAARARHRGASAQDTVPVPEGGFDYAYRRSGPSTSRPTARSTPSCCALLPSSSSRASSPSRA
jgi:hypothetical protein